jgi:hypothetical protein
VAGRRAKLKQKARISAAYSTGDGQAPCTRRPTRRSFLDSRSKGEAFLLYQRAIGPVGHAAPPWRRRRVAQAVRQGQDHADRVGF